MEKTMARPLPGLIGMALVAQVLLVRGQIAPVKAALTGVVTSMQEGPMSAGQTNIRRVFVDNSTTPLTFWVGNNEDASIIKLEPLH
jgi:hypothetical protein